MNETIKATLTADGTQFNREFQRTQETVGRFQKGMATAAKAIGAFFGARMLLNTFNRIRSEIDDLGKTATRLQLPTAQVQILSVAAKHGGTDIDALVKALNRAQVAATEASRGTATYAREFDELNINIKDFQSLDPQERLRVLADAYANATNKGDAFTALTRIMGRSVSDLIPLLQGGSAAIDELAGRVETMSEESVREMERLNDEFELLATNMKTSFMRTFVELQPMLTQFINSLGDVSDAVGFMLDPAGGIGKTGDFADALDTLRQIQQLGGMVNASQTDVGKILLERYKGMSAEVKIQAEQMAAIDAVLEQKKQGIITAEEAQKMLQAIKETGDAARQHLEAQKEIAAFEARVLDIKAQSLALDDEAAKNEEKSLPALKKKLATLETLEEQLRRIREEEAQLYTGAESGDDRFKDLESLLETTENPREREELIKAMERLLELREQAKALQEKINSETEAAADAAAEAAQAALDAKQKEMDLAKKIADQDRAKADITTDIEALKLELAGRKDLADALREETRLRHEAVELAARLGTTEENALAILRQKADLTRQLEDRAAAASGDGTPRGRASRIRQAPRFSTLGEDRRLDGRGPTLRQAALDRRGAARTAAETLAAQTRADAAKYWTQQLDLQQQLVKKFNELTTV